MQRNRPGWRVAVTGIGAVCGLGWGADSLWEGLRAGRPGIGSFHRFDHSRHRTHLASEAGEPPESFVRSCLDWRRLSIADRFALFAAREAVARAGLALPLGEEAEAGVYFGSSTGGMYESERFFARFLRDRRGRLSSLIPQQVNAPGDAVARHLGSTGPVVTFSSACASGALAVGAALDAVRAGEVEVALAGGSDSLCQLTYAGFNALRAVSAALGETFDQEAIFLFLHCQQPRLTYITPAFLRPIDSVGKSHVIGRHGLGNGTGRGPRLEKIGCNILSGANLCE